MRFSLLTFLVTVTLGGKKGGGKKGDAAAL